jgi:hypothetical protein
MINSLVYKTISRNLQSCKMSNSLSDFKQISKKNYIKREIVIKNKVIVISVPKNISKELDNILKKNYSNYNK